MRKPAALAAVALLTLGAISLAQAETIQQGSVRIHLDGAITPKRLPRTGDAPVKVAVSTKISSTSAKSPPQLTRIAIAINRYGHIDPTGLPVCEVSDIQPSTTEKALEACPGSKVGEGHFAATVALSRKVAFPAAGKLVAFNGVIGCSPSERSLRMDLRPRPGRGWPSRSRTQRGRQGERTSYSGASTQVDASSRSLFASSDPQAADRGRRDAPCHPRPAILAHVYGTQPLPTSFTLPFVIGRSKGTFGTTLTATLPAAEGNFVTGLDLSLSRTFTYRGKRRSYASASCPAPRGFPGASFAFAKASYAFAGGRKLSSSLTRSCKVRG